MMLPVTLVIPTHNRHPYLERILDYYTDCLFSLLVMDSSVVAFPQDIANKRCTYLYVPGKTFTQKLSDAFDRIDTPFVVMCADDDFIIPAAIDSCVQFLLANPAYVAADGSAICYIKNQEGAQVTYSAMSTGELTYAAEEDPFKRLNQFFNPYRSIFYAVQRTAFIKKGFNASRNAVNNLYLNEYLTCIVPITAGKYKELPIFYQVREYTSLSDDKTTPNIDAFVDSDQHATAYHAFIDSQAGAVAAITGKKKDACSVFLKNLFAAFAKDLPHIRSKTDTSLVKKAGTLISMIPFAGKKIILLRRTAERKKKLALVVQTAADQAALEKITNCINKHH